MRSKKSNDNIDKKRGLASASAETRLRISQLGGRAKHPEGRGLQTADKETRTRVASVGGKASGRGRSKKK